MDTEAIITPFDYRELCDKLSKQVIDLETQLADKVAENGRNSGLLFRANNNIKMFEDRLKDAILNEEIEEDLSEEFADIFSITLTQEVELFFTVVFRGTAQVPLNEIVEEIDWEDHVNFECNSGGSEIEFDIYEDVISVEVS
jgi:flagellar motor switch protein FliM